MIIDNNKTYSIFYKQYTSFPCSNINFKIQLSSLYYKIVDNLHHAVEKRVKGTSERPIGCLLSGGLDSSLIAALVNKFYKSDQVLQTFSIGLPGSEDLKYAAIVAKHLGTKHHEILLQKINSLMLYLKLLKLLNPMILLLLELVLEII